MVNCKKNPPCQEMLPFITFCIGRAMQTIAYYYNSQLPSPRVFLTLLKLLKGKFSKKSDLTNQVYISFHPLLVHIFIPLVFSYKWMLNICLARPSCVLFCYFLSYTTKQNIVTNLSALLQNNTYTNPAWILRFTCLQ